MEKKVIIAKNGVPPVGPYSPGIKIGNFLFISGQGPIDPTTKRIPENFEDQIKITLENIKRIIEAAGGLMAHIVKTTIFLKDMNNFNIMNQLYQKFFSGEPPARSCVEVSRLPLDIQVEIDAIAYIP